MSLTVATGLGIADQILGYFGISPTALGAKLFTGGDKKRRLLEIEMMGKQTAISAASLVNAAEGAPPEVALKLKDSAILQLSQVLAEIVKAADLDGSSGGGQ